jgi:serine protease AprX
VGAAKTNNTATRSDDRLAAFSSRGPSWYDGIAKPDVLAPGMALVSNDASGSTLESEYPSLLLKSGTSKYLRLSGSSMATGVVSGLVAVMLEANQYAAYQRWALRQEALRKNQRYAFVAPPMLSSNAVKAMLQYTATALRDDSGRTYGPLEQGTGLVNGVGAMALAYFADTTKSAGEYWLTYQIPSSTNFDGVEEAWSQRLIWGTRMMAGGSLVEVKQLAYDDNIVWGTGELDNIVWGTYSEDGDNIVWGTFSEVDNIVWGTSLTGADLTWAGNALFEDNIVWGTGMLWDDNIVWGTSIGFFDGDNIVWGTMSDDLDNIVWGTLSDDNIVWGTSEKKVLAVDLIGGGL